MIVKLKKVRLAFPAVFEAKQINGQGEPKFSACFLFEDGDENYKAVGAAISQVATEKWKEKAGAIVKNLKATDKLCLHDGDLKSDYDGFAGMFYVSASNKVRPTVVNRDRSPVTEADGVVYGGCYVNASIDVWPQDNQHGKRVNAQLRGLQFVQDGDAFGGGVNVADESDFDDLSDGLEADDLI